MNNVVVELKETYKCKDRKQNRTLAILWEKRLFIWTRDSWKLKPVVQVVTSSIDAMLGDVTRYAKCERGGRAHQVNFTHIVPLSPLLCGPLVGIIKLLLKRQMPGFVKISMNGWAPGTTYSETGWSHPPFLSILRKLFHWISSSVELCFLCTSFPMLWLFPRKDFELDN